MKDDDDDDDDDEDLLFAVPSKKVRKKLDKGLLINHAPPLSHFSCIPFFGS